MCFIREAVGRLIFRISAKREFEMVSSERSSNHKPVNQVRSGNLVVCKGVLVVTVNVRRQATLKH